MKNSEKQNVFYINLGKWKEIYKMFTDLEIENQKIADDVIITSYWEKVEVILKGKTDKNSV